MCRLEAGMYDESLLKKLGVAVIGVDRPYYGQVTQQSTLPYGV